MTVSIECKTLQAVRTGCKNQHFIHDRAQSVFIGVQVSSQFIHRDSSHTYTQEAHISKLKEGLDAGGDASLQNGLDLAVAALKSVPPYGHREVSLQHSITCNACDACDACHAWDACHAVNMHHMLDRLYLVPSCSISYLSVTIA